MNLFKEAMLKSTRLCFSRFLVVPSRCLHEANRKLGSNEVKEIKIPVPWGHVAGKWWGDTNVQPLLGLHGWEDNAGTFDTLAPQLKIPSFLAIDLPGHGFSSHLPTGRPYHLLDTVLLVRRISKYFNWNRISLMGHSFGSYMSFIYAATYPECVNTYISIECARTMFKPVDGKVEIELFSNIPDKILSLEQRNEPPSYTYDKIIDILHSGLSKSATKESCKILLKRGMHPSPKPDTFYFTRDPNARFLPLFPLSRLPFDFLLKIAPRIKCHHLSIRGMQGELVKGDWRDDVHVKTCEFIKKPGFHFEHHVVDGTHHLHLNNPERVAPLINNFLNECQKKP